MYGLVLHRTLRKAMGILCLAGFLTPAYAASELGNEVAEGVFVGGELKTWHNITLTFTGPQSGEQAESNPFLDCRLQVTFTRGQKSYTIPGYFAADGNAAESGATDGDKWRVHFVPDEVGEWSFKVSYVTGEDVALSLEENVGKPVPPDGLSGKILVEKTDKQPPDNRGRGFLQYVGMRYLQYVGTNQFFIKGGADSPENFLAYYEFDQTPQRSTQEQRKGEAKQTTTHYYQPHAGDWQPGDPTWREGKGKNIIGALNYLSQKGMNSIYFLTMNVEGDGDDVWPWTEREERFRYDCSKLDQWEIVFSHMDRIGIMLHVLTQETENDQLLDGGDLGRERKLYYRELIARFAHHLALVWNLGEENTNTTEQLKAFAEYIKAVDPYNHPIVVHTYPGQYDKVYEPLLGDPNINGPSLQMGNMKQTHAETIKWIERSAEAGPQWFVCLDEIGPADVGVKPDADDPEHRDVRHYGLWGNLMAGGAGCEWYFGYKFPHNDLNLEDFRSRDLMWNQTRYALEFFQGNLPFTEMSHNDALTSAEDDYCFAKPGEVYAVYLPNGGTTDIELAEGTYTVKWFNPRTGDNLIEGPVKQLSGPGTHSVGNPPLDNNQDWVVLIQNPNAMGR